MRKMGVNNWKQTTQERKKWKEKLSKPKLIESCRAEEEEELLNKFFMYNLKLAITKRRNM